MKAIVPLDGSDNSMRIFTTVRRLLAMQPAFEIHLVEVHDPRIGIQSAAVFLHDHSAFAEVDPFHIGVTRFPVHAWQLARFLDHCGVSILWTVRGRFS